MRIPVGIITIFHPEYFGYPDMMIPELEKYPRIIKDRKQQEAFREKISKEKGYTSTKRVFHNRIINNLGISNDCLRNKWMNGKSIKGMIDDYEIRLIDTENEDSQARYKLEARPNWGTEPNVLPDDLSKIIKKNIGKSKKICIRQLWINPLNHDADRIFSNNLYYSQRSLVNFIVGPMFSKCSEKYKHIRFERNNQCADMIQHMPNCKNKDDNCFGEVNVLKEKKFWWVNISKEI